MDYFKVALDREEQDEYNVLIAAGRRGVIRGKEILAVSFFYFQFLVSAISLYLILVFV